MGRIVRCTECGETYDELPKLEDLRENDSICVACNAPIEVADWDRVLASYEDDDFDDVDAMDESAEDDDWTGDVEIDDDDDFDDDVDLDDEGDDPEEE